MKILELEIQNTRGIRHLHLKPLGKNFSVWGPNGSGKSAVVDALDFLLTGSVSRLAGRGTRGITLKRHGPHIDCKPEDAQVAAIIEIPELDKQVKISRCMAQPNKLICDEDVGGELNPILNVASRGQHVLSRREILRFITAESGTRAQDIQSLLNITNIENIRKAFGKIRNISEREVDNLNSQLDSVKGKVNATIQTVEFDEKQTLEIANRNRKILGGKPKRVLQSSKLKDGITLPKITDGEQSINVRIIERDFENLVMIISDEYKSEISPKVDELRSQLIQIRSDPILLHALSHIKLLKIGIPLIDETGACPLCETAWPPGVLQNNLENKLEKAKEAQKYQRGIEKITKSLKEVTDTAIASLEKAIAALKTAKLSRNHLEKWREKLMVLSDLLSDPIDKYIDSVITEKDAKNFYSSPETTNVLNDSLMKLRDKYPEKSLEQTAWDTLTRLEENIKDLERVQEAYEKATTFHERAITLHDTFIASRDDVLEKLYNDISERFNELYKDLHGPDENEFDSVIHPDGAGLAFEVDFYGRGKNPPHALHSEGHQDSMGICLYLALAERLTQGMINLTVLDDVVMSVDSNHRRRFSKLIKKNFPNRQFLITTHDKTWAYQLKSDSVVNASSSIEFYNWNIETGPLVNYEIDIWERIEKSMLENDIASAASLLRRGMEEFFAYVCDSLEANVKFKLDGRNDLGDLLPAAISEYKSLLKKAKAAANSWSNAEELERLKEINNSSCYLEMRE